MSTSPPWQADAWELDADLAKIEQQWGTIRRILEDEALSALRDDEVSGWSCGEHAGHIVLIARTIAGHVQGNLAEPDRNRDETTPELALRLFTQGGFKRGVAEAPADARPEPHDRDDFLALLPEAVSAWERVRDRAGELPGCRARSHHFALGYLTNIEWVRMCAMHGAHHLRVVRDIAGEAALE